MNKYTQTRTARVIGVALMGLLMVAAGGPDAAIAASSRTSGAGDWTTVFDNLGDAGKSIAGVIGGLLLMGMIFWAWAERSVKSIGLTLLMAVVAGMAVSGQLWSTSTSQGTSLLNGGAAQAGRR